MSKYKIMLQETKNSNLFDKNYTLDEVIVMHFEKMKAKNMKNDMWKSFFFLNLQFGILQLHYRLTSSQIVFRDIK